jgi:hypothetical protein
MPEFPVADYNGLAMMGRPFSFCAAGCRCELWPIVGGHENLHLGKLSPNLVFGRSRSVSRSPDHDYASVSAQPAQERLYGRLMPQAFLVLAAAIAK